MENVKPDVHVRRFVENTLGRTCTDAEIVQSLTRAAHALGLKAYELDWRIWEASRAGLWDAGDRGHPPPAPPVKGGEI